MGSGNSINKFFADEEDAILQLYFSVILGFHCIGAHALHLFHQSLHQCASLTCLIWCIIRMASLIGLQSCLPEAKDFFYPMVCIPFLLASTQHIGVSADITAAKQTLEHVLHLPSVATLRNACSMQVWKSMKSMQVWKKP